MSLASVGPKGCERLIEKRRASTRNTVFADHGRTEFVRYFTARELKILGHLNLHIDAFSYWDLGNVARNMKDLDLTEAYRQVRIYDHVVAVMSAFETFVKASSDASKLRIYLRGRGNRDIVDNEGLLGNVNDFLWFNQLIQDLKIDRSFYRIVVATLWLHDIGKLVSQADHPKLSRMVVERYPDVRGALTQIFSEEELHWLAILNGNHSVLADSVFCRERRLFNARYSILKDVSDPEMRLKILKATVLITLADVDSYNRLTPKKIKDLITEYNLIREMIERGVVLNSPEDLKTEELNDLVWGKQVFASLSALEEVPQEQAELAEGQIELARLIPSEVDRRNFFESLGQIPLIGLIFNLRREFTPTQRVRLLIWVVRILKEKINADNWLEFCYDRFNEKGRKQADIDHLRRILEQDNIEGYAAQLDLRVDAFRGCLMVYVPA